MIISVSSYALARRIASAWALLPTFVFVVFVNCLTDDSVGFVLSSVVIVGNFVRRPLLRRCKFGKLRVENRPISSKVI